MITDGTGVKSFSYNTSVALPLGANVTATATRGAFASGSNAPTAASLGSTSEFSAAVTVINAPTAAEVTVSGRVVSSTGSPLSAAVITMTDQNGNSHTARTNSFGYFTDIPSGGAYIVGTQRRGFTFDSFMLQVKDAVSDVTITAK
ncbi:MAG: carboxypeptidase regulatory-like domain-containing protein [Acidobacteriales bacterium]|nr:carboxypeptidase regulatory-like domain-containing protein [Terriglobales bacterium]